jgi:hypothetical protein
MKGWNYAVRLYRPRSRGNAHQLGPLLAVGTAKYKVIAIFWGSFDLGVTRFSGLNRSRSQRRAASRKASRPKERRQRTKQNLVLQMLRRPSGVSIDDIVSKTAWQPHSVRSFLSGVVRKKLKLQLISELGKDGVRRYGAASLTPAKA